MRGTPTYLTRFWKDRSGATPAEVVIILAAFGAVLGSGMIIEKGSIAQAIQDYGEAVGLNPSISTAYIDDTEAIHDYHKFTDAPSATALVTATRRNVTTTMSSPRTTQKLELAPAGTPEADSRSFAIQLASVRTEGEAEVEWERLQRRFPDLLARRDLVVQTVDLETRGTFFRVLTGPFENRTEAQDLCAEFKFREKDCLAIRL